MHLQVRKGVRTVRTRRSFATCQRRLFHQRKPDGTGTRAAELGFGFAIKEAGDVVLDDEYQLRQIEAAGDDYRQRFDAVYGLLLKKLKNVRLAAESLGDEHMLDICSGIYERIADQMIIAVGDLMAAATAAGYRKPRPAE